MTGVLDGLVCAALIVGGTLGARWAGWRWHGWHLRRVHAQHAGPVAEELPPDPYWAYGSMTLADERDWQERVQLPRLGGHLRVWGSGHTCDSGVPHEGECVCECGIPAPYDEELPEFLPADPAEPGWREQTMAELSPQALATGPGPGVVAPSHGPPPGPDPRLCGPEQPHEKPAGTESAGSGHPYDVFDQFYRDTRALERLAHTGDIYGARLDLGPRAAAVLERYEQRRQERWAFA